MSDELDDKNAEPQPPERRTVPISLDDIDTTPDREHEPNSYDEARRGRATHRGTGKRSGTHIAQVARAARKGLLKPELGMPLDTMLEAMRDAIGCKRELQRAYSPTGEWVRMNTEQRETVMALNAAAVEFASRAAPFLHAKLAPHVPKGQGQVVALIIEDA